MGLRGPAPTPTALNIIRGNPGKRALNHTESQAGPLVAEPPEYLDAAAVNEWNRLVPLLSKLGVLRETDDIALAQLCATYSTMMKAQAQLAKKGLLYTTQRGDVAQHPLVGIVNQNMIMVRRLLQEFGMTPSARSRIHADAKPFADPKDEWAARDRRMTESG